MCIEGMAQTGTQPPLDKFPISVIVMPVFHPPQLVKLCSSGSIQLTKQEISPEHEEELLYCEGD